MIDKIKHLSQELNSKRDELNSITDQVINLDSARVEKVLNISISGLSLDKIWATKKKVIPGDDEITKTVYEYLEVDGKKLKGVKVGEYKGENYSSDILKDREDKYELWLTPNSFIKTHVTGETVKEVWGRLNYKRDIVSLDYDPLTLTGNLDYEWDIDYIIEAIYNHLSKRNDDLNYRIIKQEERLDKLKELKIL